MLKKPFVRVLFAALMLAAVSFRLRVNIYEPITDVLRSRGLWPLSELMHFLEF